MFAMAQAVAGYMGNDWTAAPGVWQNDRDAYVVHRDGIRKIHIQADRTPNRLYLSGSFPNEKAWSNSKPYDMTAQWSITVGGSRPAEQIAREINKRLLPDYSRDIEIVRGRVEDSAKREMIRGVVLRDIVEAFGDDIDDAGTDRHGHTELGRYSEPLTGSVHVSYPDLDGTFKYGVDFKISLPTEKAVMLARFLKTLR